MHFSSLFFIFYLAIGIAPSSAISVIKYKRDHDDPTSLTPLERRAAPWVGKLAMAGAAVAVPAAVGGMIYGSQKLVQHFSHNSRRSELVVYHPYEHEFINGSHSRSPLDAVVPLEARDTKEFATREYIVRRRAPRTYIDTMD
ncbi:hypothetical protein F5148DRAFT_1152885 [Russula earlei]|uniref:Uncharacterized protein n=1 Tax=Russula earlei TaxID=71964 RepID=A0ACC0TUX7_9AGAM|nr:hypothetical protein F5148DRAFT_1152885 [Russula earlei]